MASAVALANYSKRRGRKMAEPEGLLNMLVSIVDNLSTILEDAKAAPVLRQMIGEQARQINQLKEIVQSASRPFVVQKDELPILLGHLPVDLIESMDLDAILEKIRAKYTDCPRCSKRALDMERSRCLNCGEDVNPVE